MKRLLFVTALLATACVHVAPKPPAQPTPRPTPAPTATPSPTPTPAPAMVPPKRVASVYFSVGPKWETQAQQGNLYRETATFVTAWRAGGYDFQWNDHPELATIQQRIDSLHFYVSAISAEFPGKHWLPGLEYVPGRTDCGALSAGFSAGALSPAVTVQTDRGLRVTAFARRGVLGFSGGVVAEDSCLRPQLEAFRAVWDRVDWLEFDSLDEYGGDASDVAAAGATLRATTNSMGLAPKPLALTQYAGQIADGSGVARCKAVDICSLEGYVSPPGTGPQAGEVAKVNALLDSQAAAVAPQPVIGIPMGYSRNYDYLSRSNNEAVLLAAFGWCSAHEPQCIGVDTFSWARASGSRELGFGAYLQRGLSIVQGHDSGTPEPEDLPAPTPKPTPIVGPGSIVTPSVNNVFPAGTTTAAIGIARKDGTRGEIVLSYSVTCDSTGEDCTGANVAAGALTFADGADGAVLSFTIPPQTQPGQRVWLVRELSVSGGGQIDSGPGPSHFHVTVAARDSDPSVNFWVSSGLVVPGNPWGIVLERGDCRQPAAGSWCLEPGSTLADGVDYDYGGVRCGSLGAHPAWSMDAGVCQFFTSFPTTYGAISGHAGVLTLLPDDPTRRVGKMAIAVQ